MDYKDRHRAPSSSSSTTLGLDTPLFHKLLHHSEGVLEAIEKNHNDEDVRTCLVKIID